MTRNQCLNPLRHNAHHRGAAVVALVVAMLVISLIVVGMMLGGARDQDLMMVRMSGLRSLYAADSAANLAVKELMDNIDYDSDGAVGTISDDGNTATDPQLAGSPMWATGVDVGGAITVTARARNSAANRAVEVALSGTGAISVASTVLLVVNNSAVLDAQESARVTIIQGWGYTVALISATASQATFDNALRTSSVVYISETANSSDVSTKLTGATLGVVTEESALSDELGFSASMTTFTGNTVNIINNSHYITSGFTTGTLSLFTAGQPVRYLSGSYGGFTTLGRQVSTTNPTFAVMERQDALTPSGTAQGRRVYLPWGNTGVNINALTSDGQTIMRRSIEWCLLPVGYWKLDEVSGSTAVDDIAGRNGTLSGPSWTTGRLDGGLEFDGFNDYVSISNHTAFQVTKALTIAGWVKGDGWPIDPSWVSIILRKGDSNPNNWQLAIWNGRVSFNLDSNDDAGIKGNTTLTTGTWFHVAATWDGSTVRLYVNGVLDHTPQTRAAPIGTDTRAVYLGGRISSTDITNGIVDDVRFYNRALTAAEILAMTLPEKTITSWAEVAP